MRLLIDRHDGFLAESRDVLRAGLQTASWVTVDDTGARHAGRNGFCTQIGNDDFTWFGTTGSKSRLNFLNLLRAGHADYVVNDAALHANKPELLRVLDRPEIPLHTNGSERDIRCQVIKRKISGGTRSNAGRDCRDALLGLMQTCAKLGIGFCDYLTHRLGGDTQLQVPKLADLIRCRGHPA